MIERIAHAKINLALHVTGQRDDGYHLLDTLVVFAEVGDRITVSKPHHPHGPIAVSLDGQFGSQLSAGPENLVSSAALMLRDALVRSGVEPAPVEITLEKNLPVASGIGGGSADAAATLLALREFWQSEINLAPFAEQLGADVSMCLKSRPLRAQGIGHQLQELALDDPLHLVLVNPGVSLSTPDVFAALMQKENSPISANTLKAVPATSDLKALRNDLEQPASNLAPAITEVREAITHQGSMLTRMSGSGATCFGIFDTEHAAMSAAEAIQKTHPDWWCVATDTIVS